MKRLAAVILVMMFCFAALQAQAFSLTGLETESVSREWKTNRFFERMTKLTGIETDASALYDQKEYAKLLEGMLKGEVTTDVLFKANLTREQEIALLDSGAIVDLAPMIRENMPNLSALLDESPQWLETIALEDGRIASLPQINQGERLICLWINKAWLNALKLKMPETTQELTDVLLAFKTRDPNGNLKEDEDAADLLGVYEMRWLLPYFSIISDDYYMARGSEGEYVFAPELPGYRDFVALLKEWNDLGLFGDGAFTSVHNASSLGSDDDETVTSGLIVTVAPYTHVVAERTADYVPLLMAGPDGSIRWRDAFGAVWTGAFAVTSACEDPAQALRWVDALYGEAGSILAYAGEEGDEYRFSENGKWTFVVDMMRTIDDIRSESIIYTGVTTPGVTPNEFLGKVDSDIDRHVINSMNEVRAVSEQVSPGYLLGEKDRARANEIMLTLGRVADEGIGRFATGEIELTDENWNAWLESLREAGSEELTALFNAAIK
ncbi:MAG: hypothetical protein IKU34_10730 [Clostridia bacterium]|nr:hypothetical protein [Clostridia bacterium]